MEYIHVHAPISQLDIRLKYHILGVFAIICQIIQVLYFKNRPAGLLSSRPSFSASRSVQRRVMLCDFLSLMLTAGTGSRSSIGHLIFDGSRSRSASSQLTAADVFAGPARQITCLPYVDNRSAGIPDTVFSRFFRRLLSHSRSRVIFIGASRSIC